MLHSIDVFGAVALCPFSVFVFDQKQSFISVSVSVENNCFTFGAFSFTAENKKSVFGRSRHRLLSGSVVNMINFLTSVWVSGVISRLIF